MARLEGKHRKTFNAAGQTNRGEFIIRCLTLGLAVGSTAFAAHMISDAEHQPDFAGLEYLSIFNKPNGYASRLALKNRPANTAQSDIDFTSVGSINDLKAKTNVSRYSILQATSESAIVQTPQTIMRVRRGDRIDGLGFVEAIDNRNGRWIIVTRDGSVISN